MIDGIYPLDMHDLECFTMTYKCKLTAHWEKGSHYAEITGPEHQVKCEDPDLSDAIRLAVDAYRAEISSTKGAEK